MNARVPRDAFAEIDATDHDTERVTGHNARMIGELAGALATAELTLESLRGRARACAEAAAVANQRADRLANWDRNPEAASEYRHRAHLWESHRTAATTRSYQLEAQIETLQDQLAAARQSHALAMTELATYRRSLVRRLSPDATGAWHQAEPASRAELELIRGAIKREDWSDLTEFHGTVERHERVCRTCGAQLSNDQKRFCSRSCRELFVGAFGTDLHPKRRRR